MRAAAAVPYRSAKQQKCRIDQRSISSCSSTVQIRAAAAPYRSEKHQQQQHRIDQRSISSSSSTVQIREAAAAAAPYRSEQQQHRIDQSSSSSTVQISATAAPYRSEQQHRTGQHCINHMQLFSAERINCTIILSISSSGKSPSSIKSCQHTTTSTSQNISFSLTLLAKFVNKCLYIISDFQEHFSLLLRSK